MKQNLMYYLDSDFGYSLMALAIIIFLVWFWFIKKPFHTNCEVYKKQ